MARPTSSKILVHPLIACMLPFRDKFLVVAACEAAAARGLFEKEKKRAAEAERMLGCMALQLQATAVGTKVIVELKNDYV